MVTKARVVRRRWPVSGVSEKTFTSTSIDEPKTALMRPLRIITLPTRIEVKKATESTLGQLTESLREGLPEALAENLVAAATRENRELVIVGSSSAWAARLRFESNEIMENARRQGIDVERCRVIVQTSQHL